MCWPRRAPRCSARSSVVCGADGMPELPEVECLRRSLEPGLLGRTVVRVTVRRREVIVAPGDPCGGFSRHRGEKTPARLDHTLMLRGGRIESLTRHGKQLAIIDHRNHAVIVQLGMTGGLALSADVRHPPHTHVVWRLDNDTRLRFIDARRFGLVRAAPEGPPPLWADLGPDALSIRTGTLHAGLSGSHRAIKAALLDQRVLAGVGNIYADEALHRAGIHPARPACGLSRRAAGVLAGHIRRIFRGAIERGGSTIRDYRDGEGRRGAYQHRHRVYGRGGQPCVCCGGTLTQCTIAQRTTVYCPNCQAESG